MYGIVHRRTLSKQDILHKEQAAEKQRDSWIAQAKQAYKDKVEKDSQSPLQRLTGGKKNEGATTSHDTWSIAVKLMGVCSYPKSPVISDPEDPKFDLEKLVASWEKQAA